MTVGTRTEKATFPQTTYAVALLYILNDDTKRLLANRMFTASGVDPLTREEVIARARRMQQSDGSDGEGPGWTFMMACVSMMVQREGASHE